MDAKKEKIPLLRIRETLDDHLAKKEYEKAENQLAYWLDEAKKKEDESGEVAILNELMGLYRKLNKKDDALRVITEAVERIDVYRMNDTITAASTYTNVAAVYKAFGDFFRSIAFYAKAKTILEKELTPGDPRLANLYNKYALALTDAGEYSKALLMYKNALDIMGTSKVKNGELDCAVTYLNIAKLYESKEGMVRAEDKIYDFLDKAYEALINDGLPKDAYFKMVVGKCIPVFDYFGQFLRSSELKNLLVSEEEQK